MKISEIARPSTIVKEGVVEPNVMMSVQNIIQRGRADNTFEFMIVARLLQLLKQGDFYKTSNPIFDGNLSTSKELMDYLRACPPAEMLSIAQHLWGALQLKDKDALYAMANPAQETIEWLKLFHAHEADD